MADQERKLPVLIQQIINADKLLEPLRECKIVRLDGHWKDLIRTRRNLVQRAHETWGRQAKGKN